MEKVEIIINNQRSQLVCSPKLLFKVRKLMRIKAKNYFWSQAWRNRAWDGYIQYVTEKGGYFPTGLLDQICNHLDDLNYEYEFSDNRKRFKPIRIIKQLGNLTLRDDQVQAIRSMVYNKFKNISYPRGIMAEATNYGKSIVAMGIFMAYKRDRTGLFLVNSKTLFNQALQDFIKYLGKDIVGWVSADKGVNWKRVNVCMVQTLESRMRSDLGIRNNLIKQDIILIDEYDALIGRKGCQTILNNCYNAYVRVGFSGSALKGMDKNKKQLQLKYTGPIIHEKTNRELVDEGISVKPIIQFYSGNKSIQIKGDWNEEYDSGVVRNRGRNKKIWRLTSKYLSEGQVLILFKLHEHGRELMDICPQELLKSYRISMINHKSLNRDSALKKFNEGRIDILVSSMIIKRGINLPGIRTLINAAGGNSEENLLQILGRALRRDENKNQVRIIEFFDIGYYLRRHSKHRINYYKKQEFTIQELYKKTINK